MGSALGNYIHLYKENYMDIGTNRYKDNKSKEVTAKIFEDHAKFILNQAENLKIPNLKQVETTYNELNQKQYKELKYLATDKNLSDKRKENVVRYLMQNLKTKTMSQETVQKIIDNLEWDDARQTLVYRPKDKDLIKETRIKLPSIKGNDKTIRQANTILTRAEALRDSIDANPELQYIKDEYLKRIDNNIIKPIKSIDGLRERTTEEIAKLNRKYKYTYYQLSADDSEKYYTELSKIVNEIQGVARINTLIQQKFSELLGNMVAEGAVNISYGEVAKVLQEGIKIAGDNTTSKNLKQIYVSADLDLKELDKLGFKIEKSGTYIDSKSNVKTSYTLKGVGDDKQQKADVEFGLGIQMPKIGISMKNTYLPDKINEQIEETVNKFSINLQGNSPLILYLAGAQQAYGNDIANHYLNVLAQHEEGTMQGDSIHDAAMRSLGLAIVYSAFTGANQLREGGRAQILAIYNKRKNGIKQVQFFDICDLMQKINREGLDSTVKMSPMLQSIVLQNAKENDKETKEENISLRLTKVLADSRKKHISVNILKSLLISQST